MDKPVLIIEMPELNDEAITALRNFIHELLISFEAHYFHKLQRYHDKVFLDDDIDDIF